MGIGLTFKNQKRKQYSNWRLEWMSFIAGKRESRRLIGDLIPLRTGYKQSDTIPGRMRYNNMGNRSSLPDPKNSQYYPGNEFLGIADHNREFEPYHIPYRCFYSKDINNLFMAGRNISVTHIALGTVRVMQTTGMMGEVVGMAAFLCKKYNCSPPIYIHNIWKN